MMTNGATITTLSALPNAEQLSALTATQKVVVVNRSAEVLQLLDNVLDAGNYDVVVVESIARAYSQIKRVQPNLVILCVAIDDASGFQVLSMLKLDEATREIPVLTCTTEYEWQESDESDDVADASAFEMFGPKPATVSMN